VRVIDADGWTAGQGVQFFGNVTGALQFDVNVDGAVIRGAPAGQMLASVSGLRQSDHSVSLTVTQVGSGSQLLFESAIVTVGTGFTGCALVHKMKPFSRADALPQLEVQT
jgi:hypothetical protein